MGTVIRGVLSYLRSRPLISLRRLISYSPTFYYALYFTFELKGIVLSCYVMLSMALTALTK